MTKRRLPQVDPRATIEIDAPLDDVWAVMMDLPRYGEWNPFLFRAECAHPAVGEPIVLFVRWPNGKTTRSPEQISVIEEPATLDEVRRATLAYVYQGVPSKLGLVKGTRFQRLTQEAGGPTTYDTVENFSGPLVPLAGPDRVADGFRRHAEALKARCERPPQGRT